jgi:hypothetical protein
MPIPSRVMPDGMGMSESDNWCIPAAVFLRNHVEIGLLFKLVSFKQHHAH